MKQAAPKRLIKPTLSTNEPFCLKYSKKAAKANRPKRTIKFTYFGVGLFSDRQNNPRYIKLAIKQVFANVSKAKEVIDANANNVNADAMSARAVSQNFSGCPTLTSLNKDLEPKSNPQRIKAETKKNISFANFIDLNTTTLIKSD